MRAPYMAKALLVASRRLHGLRVADTITVARAVDPFGHDLGRCKYGDLADGVAP